jgi:3-isopropylmalate dehydrogenase
MHTDAAAQALVLEPERFDVLVMENFVGDLLSELGAATVGGVGLCASGNYGERLAYFEPVHGSAPALAGRNLANPISQVLAAAMLLDHLGERSAATRIRRATRDVLADGRLRLAADGTVPAGTRTATDVIVAALRVS